MKFWIVTFLLLGFIPNSNAHADGNKLLAQCLTARQFIDTQSKIGTWVDVGNCLGFVSGVIGTMTMFGDVIPPNLRACLQYPSLTRSL